MFGKEAIPKNFTAYYGFTITGDVTNQVSYTHQTLGLTGNINVSVSVGGGVSFSSGVGVTRVDYPGSLLR